MEENKKEEKIKEQKKSAFTELLLHQAIHLTCFTYSQLTGHYFA